MVRKKKTILEAVGRNPVHPFPARMAPDVVLEAIDGLHGSVRLLDPMMGSGTVLAIARFEGHRVVGVDSDPLAVLLARVWTTTIDGNAVLEKAAEVLKRARILFQSLTVGDAYPKNADAETRKFLRYWFDDYARRQLAGLASAISRVRDERIREVLWCGFSRLIITKQAGASLAMDLSHSRPHKKFKRAPIKPFNKFLAAVNTVVSNCPQRGAERLGPPPQVSEGDARRLDIEDASIDIVVTSPPYLNAIDYLRCSKFSLVWMGYNVSALRKIRGESIGAESASPEAVAAEWVQLIITNLGLTPRLNTRDHRLLCQYVWDMNAAISETARVLRSGAPAIYVVGDSTVRGTFIRNSRIVSVLAHRHGLSLVSQHSRPLPANRRYLPPPSLGADESALDSRMRREVVMEFRKAA
jgi:SAM-dependent methyltransferase